MTSHSFLKFICNSRVGFLSSMEAALARKHQQLRGRLNQHGFTQRLDAGSLDLVSALLTRLVCMCESRWASMAGLAG